MLTRQCGPRHRREAVSVPVLESKHGHDNPLRHRRGAITNLDRDQALQEPRGRVPRAAEIDPVSHPRLLQHRDDRSLPRRRAHILRATLLDRRRYPQPILYGVLAGRKRRGHIGTGRGPPRSSHRWEPHTLRGEECHMNGRTPVRERREVPHAARGDHSAGRHGAMEIPREGRPLIRRHGRRDPPRPSPDPGHFKHGSKLPSMELAHMRSSEARRSPESETCTSCIAAKMDENKRF